jgi:hypothetical protein
MVTVARGEGEVLSLVYQSEIVWQLILGHLGSPFRRLTDVC